MNMLNLAERKKEKKEAGTKVSHLQTDPRSKNSNGVA
jgi:hypothetical protein